MNLFDFSFKESKFKPHLKMAVERIKIATNRKTNAVKTAQREIAKLLVEEKDEKAAIKVEAVIREDATIEAYGIIELICDLLHERSRLIAAEKTCPEDLIPAVHTIIWATNRADIPELHEVKRQLKLKYGAEFVERAERNADNAVNERVVHKLSIRPPSAAVVLEYLQEIAKKHELKWVPTERFRSEADKIWSAMPAPTGFSVPMAPATQFGHLYGTEAQPIPSAGPPGMVIATPVNGGLALPPAPGIAPTAGPHINKEGLLDFRSPEAGAQEVPGPYAPPPVAYGQLPGPSDTDGSGGAGGGGASVAYEMIPLPPSQLPILPPELPMAPPSSMGPTAPGAPPDVDDLEARFNNLRGKG